MDVKIDVNLDQFSGAMQQAQISRLGIDSDKVRAVTIELNRLRAQGLLIDVNVKGVGMFVRRAQFAEVGVTENDERVKRYTPGSKYLIPKDVVERLRSVEVRMREAVNKFSYGEIEGFKPYRWLPWKSYRAFRDRWDTLLAEFEDMKQEILENYDVYRDQITGEFAQGARNAWKSVVNQGYTALIYQGKGYWDMYDFIDAVVEDALNMFPTPERIRAELKADYRVGLVQSDVDTLHEEEIRRLQLEAAKTQNDKAHVELTEATRKFQHEDAIRRLERQKREMEVEAMMQAELAHAKAQLAEIKAPFEEVFTALRDQIAADCASILESIQKNKFLRGKVAEKANGLVELYDLLAIHDDEKLRAKLVELRAAIGAVGEERTKEDKRDTEAIKSTLEDIIELSHKVAEDLDAARASFLEVD